MWMLKYYDISVRFEVLTALPQPLDATMLVDRDGTCVSSDLPYYPRFFFDLSFDPRIFFDLCQKLTLFILEQNTMPGWDPLSMWNPVPASADPDCKLNPMYQERGMGYGASYGGAY
jgi:hypothetical protein